MDITVVNDLAPGAFVLEVTDQDKIIHISLWEDGEVIAEDLAEDLTIISPGIEDWKRLRLIAGRAIKELEKSES